MIKVNYKFLISIVLIGLIQVQCRSGNKIEEGQNNVFGITLIKGYQRYYNDLNQLCLEGEFDGKHCIGTWRAFNAVGEMTTTIYFFDENSLKATFFAGHSGEKLFSYLVRNDTVIDFLCPSYDGATEYSCMEKDRTYQLNLTYSCLTDSTEHY